VSEACFDGGPRPGGGNVQVRVNAQKAAQFLDALFRRRITSQCIEREDFQITADFDVDRRVALAAGIGMFARYQHATPIHLEQQGVPTHRVSVLIYKAGYD
jgi:hypothetical protein